MRKNIAVDWPEQGGMADLEGIDTAERGTGAGRGKS